MSASTASLSEDESQPPAIQYCLTVDFLLTNLPTAHDLTELCNSLKILATKKRLPAQKFIWNNMYRKGEEVPVVAKVAALKWRAQALRNGSKANKRSSSIGEAENATANVNGQVQGQRQYQRTKETEGAAQKRTSNESTKPRRKRRRT
jgi:hypothetical protein